MTGLSTDISLQRKKRRAGFGGFKKQWRVRGSGRNSGEGGETVGSAKGSGEGRVRKAVVRGRVERQGRVGKAVERGEEAVESAKGGEVRNSGECERQW